MMVIGKPFGTLCQAVSHNAYAWLQDSAHRLHIVCTMFTWSWLAVQAVDVQTPIQTPRSHQCDLSAGCSGSL